MGGVRNNIDPLPIEFRCDEGRMDILGRDIAVTGDPAKIKMGLPQSLYELDSYYLDLNKNASGAQGTHALVVNNDSFLFTEGFNNKGIVERVLVMIVLRPVVCADFTSQKISTNGISEVQSDSTYQIPTKHVLPDVTFTCNPTAPAFSVSPSISAAIQPATKLADYLKRNHQQLLR